MADFVVDNSGDLRDTERQALAVLKKLRTQRGPLYLSRWVLLVFLFLLVVAIHRWLLS